MFGSPYSLRIALVTIAIMAPTLGAQSRSPLHGTLASGPHGVGFMKRELRDPVRLDLPKLDAAGRPQSADRSRRMRVHVWYPTAQTAGQPMTFRDYMFSHHADTATDAYRRSDEANRRRFFGQFGTVTDTGWSRLLATPLHARRDASPTVGRFPLVIGMLRTLSTTVTNEYLASHGYVVAMIDAFQPDNPDPGPGLEVAVRDMEFAVPELRKLAFVDPAKLAALGFSGSGFSQILFAMRHPDVDAVSDLESAIFDDRVYWPLNRGWGYNVTALRVPFLHTYSVPLSKLENRFVEFEMMRYAPRHHYLVDAPGIHHWDFATEGMAASTVLRIRGANGPRLQQAFETTNRYLLAFFNAYVKGDQTELAFLRRDPAANGAPAGLATIRELPAVRAAPSVEAFQAMLRTQGAQAAMAVFNDALRVDPQAPLFNEARLNQMAYRLLREEKRAEAIAVFRAIVALNPRSSNAYDSLAEALEASGERAEAVSMTRKGLEVLATEDLTPERRQQMKDALEGRIRRLAP
jgi:tetratricopeptide (TPR) repeat protein